MSIGAPGERCLWTMLNSAGTVNIESISSAPSIRRSRCLSATSTDSTRPRREYASEAYHIVYCRAGNTPLCFAGQRFRIENTVGFVGLEHSFARYPSQKTSNIQPV
jgi:hypothetical protein